MNLKIKHSYRAYGLLCFILFSQVVRADNIHDFATLQSNGNTVYWSIDTDINYESIKLTLSSDGKLVQTATSPEPATHALEDGNYQFELTVIPALDKAVVQQLKAARAANGGKEVTELVEALKEQGKLPKQPLIQSGSFTIINGQLLSAATEQ